MYTYIYINQTYRCLWHSCVKRGIDVTLVTIKTNLMSKGVSLGHEFHEYGHDVCIQKYIWNKYILHMWLIKYKY